MKKSNKKPSRQTKGERQTYMETGKMPSREVKKPKK